MASASLRRLDYIAQKNSTPAQMKMRPGPLARRLMVVFRRRSISGSAISYAHPGRRAVAGAALSYGEALT